MAGKNVNKVVVNGSAIFDLTGVTVTPETLAKGVTAHDKSGAQITGTAETSGLQMHQVSMYYPEKYAFSLKPNGLSGTNVSASTNAYHGYCAEELPFLLKYGSNCCLMLSALGIQSGSSENTYIYNSNTWYKLIKMPSNIALSSQHEFFANVYNHNKLFLAKVKIAKDGTVYFSTFSKMVTQDNVASIQTCCFFED